MTTLKRKLRARSGVTLMETLTAVLILALLAGVILVGSRSMLTVYQGHTFANESALVSDTINTALGDVFRYATVSTSGGSVHFENLSIAADTQTSPNTPGETQTCVSGDVLLINCGKIWLPGTDGKSINLLNSAAYSDLYVLSGDETDVPENPLTYSGTISLSVSGGAISGSYKLYDPFSGECSDSITFTFRPVNGIS